MGGEDLQRAEAVMAARRPARQRTLRGRTLRSISIPASIAVSIAAASGLVVRERARRELRGFASEQAALRRVATLVARAARPEEVFGAVVAEVGQLLAVELSQLNRYDPDGSATTVVGAWARTGSVVAFPVGTRWHLGGRNVSTLVMETGRTARVDDYSDAAGEPADAARVRGVRSSVGVPITVEGRLWGHMSVASTQEQRFPADTEARLGNFAELVATAIANAQARLELRSYAAEQAALRRVATLVARAAPPHDVFAAVTKEVGRLVDADFTIMNRYDPVGGATALGAWAKSGAVPTPVGSRLELGGRNVTTLVHETGKPAHVDRYGADAGQLSAPAVAAGLRSAAGAPIRVEGRLWGVIVVGSRREDPLPAGIVARLAGFTELVASAIANAESQAQLTASRARIVAAADNARRRIERDLHDGAQHRLVALAMQLRAVQAAAPPDAGDLREHLDELAAHATAAVDELRELARGIHPAVLAEGGLRPALRALARRSTVPVRLDVRGEGRFPEQVEIAAYYVVSEALTNAAKHADASVVDVSVEVSGDVRDGTLHVRICDDGRGGADPAGGSGLVGLKDRVEALSGRLSVRTAIDSGTCVEVELPLGVRSDFG
jgi:signal transduction histidine kinase